MLTDCLYGHRVQEATIETIVRVAWPGIDHPVARGTPHRIVRQRQAYQLPAQISRC